MHNHRKQLAGLLALVLTATGASGGLCFGETSSAPKVSAATLLGDLNGDGSVSIADLVLLQRYLTGVDSTCSANADVNADGRVNVFDSTMLKRTLLGTYQPAAVTGLYLNEICTQNDTTITDSDGAYSDWIELYNSTDTAMDLSGYGLSDKAGKPYKWTFPAGTTIAADGYLLVYASDKNTVVNGELHANFKLSKDGETVLLSHPTLGTLDTLTVPELKADVTYGRFRNGSANLTKLTPTPGRSNDFATELREVTPPTLSQVSGFYQNDFTVTISAPAGLTIYYTLDGSDPTTSSTAYTAGISVRNRSGDANVYAAMPDQSVYSDFTPSVRIDKATVLRAVAVDADGFVSPTTTATYFVGISQATTYNGYPVVSISTAPDNLFDATTGIFVKGDVYTEYKKTSGGVWGGWGGFGGDDGSTPANYNQRGSAWERAAHLDFFEGDGTLGFSQDIGIRTMGGWSRANLQKNIRCYARGDYGATKFNYDLIPGLTMESDGTTPLQVFDSFLLRAGGNDAESTKLRDVFIQSLVEDRALDTQGNRICIVFIDGEYWGVYNLQEDYDDDYIENNYGIDKDQVIIFKVGELDEGEESDSVYYDNLISFARDNDLSVDANYQTISGMMDMENFIDYYATEIYIANSDWPANNYRMWRTREVSDVPYADGKWRWMLYDTEMSFDLYYHGEGYQKDSISIARGDSGTFGSDHEGAHYVLFYKLLQNKTFLEQFVTTLMDLRNVNFEPEHAISVLNSYADRYRPVMTDQFERFGPASILNEYNTPVDYFNGEISDISGYLRNRYNYLPTLVKSALSLRGEAVQVQVSANNAAAGTVQCNTATLDLSGGSFTGTYFTDYAVTLTATPAAGHSFTGWSGDVTSTDTTITVPLSKAVTLQANFK